MDLIGWKRARTTDRDAAVDLINAAYADGQLTADERDDRVHRALVAKLVGDLDQITADLQPTRTGPRDDHAVARPRLSRRAIAALLTAVVVLGGAAIVLNQPDAPEDPPVVHQESPPYAVPATADAVEQLIADYREEFGTSQSYGISLQQALSTVRVPTNDGHARYREWRLTGAGTFEPNGDPRGANDQREFDLAGIDTQALSHNIESALTSLNVEDPTLTTIVIAHWDHDEQPTIAITVSNDFDESGYFVTDLGGVVIDEEPYGAN